MLKQYSFVTVVLLLLIGLSLPACRNLPHASSTPSCLAAVEARLQKGKTVRIERVDGTRIERVRVRSLSLEHLTYETAGGEARELPLDKVRAIEVRMNRGGFIGSLIGAAPGVALYVVASRTNADDVYDEMAAGWGKAGGLLLGSSAAWWGRSSARRRTRGRQFTRHRRQGMDVRKARLKNDKKR